MATRPGSRPPAALLLGALLVAAVVLAVGANAAGVPAAPGTSPSPSLAAVVGTPAPSSSSEPRTMPPLPSMSTLPSPIDFPERTATPPPTPAPTRRPDVADGPTYRVATRVVVPALDIDLPVMNQRTSYPACNVAMFLADYRKPGQGRATYLYAHAREGMFLPLLTQSKRNDGAAMIGMTVHVYTGDNKRFTYEIYRVRRHASDLRPVVAAKGETIWLQTSEGPNASYPKLQVAGRLTGSSDATFDDAHPKPRPVAC
jgi:sortase (surface protein transpeptidase)